jgi:hypothetical protein
MITTGGPPGAPDKPSGKERVKVISEKRETERNTSLLALDPPAAVPPEHDGFVDASGRLK